MAIQRINKWPQFTAKLKALFKEKRVTTYRLDKANIANNGNMSNILNGYARATDDTLSKLAAYEPLGIDLATLQYWRNLDEFPELVAAPGMFTGLADSVKSHSVDDDVVILNVVTDKVAAGRGLCLEGLEQTIDRAEAIPAKFVKNPNESILFEVEGDSMEPRLYTGDLVLVDCTASPRTGHLVVVQLDGHLMVKLLKASRGKWELHSYNPAYDVVTVEKDIEYCWAVTKIFGNG